MNATASLVCVELVSLPDLNYAITWQHLGSTATLINVRLEDALLSCRIT